MFISIVGASKGQEAQFFPGEDYAGLTQQLVDERLITSNMKNVYDLFMANYTAVIEKGEIESSINYYISEVEHSTLTNVEKEALIASFIVASQSPFYLLTK